MEEQISETEQGCPSRVVAHLSIFRTDKIHVAKPYNYGHSFDIKLEISIQIESWCWLVYLL